MEPLLLRFSIRSKYDNLFEQEEGVNFLTIRYGWKGANMSRVCEVMRQIKDILDRHLGELVFRIKDAQETKDNKRLADYLGSLIYREKQMSVVNLDGDSKSIQKTSKRREELYLNGYLQMAQVVSECTCGAIFVSNDSMFIFPRTLPEYSEDLEARNLDIVLGDGRNKYIAYCPTGTCFPFTEIEAGYTYMTVHGYSALAEEAAGGLTPDKFEEFIKIWEKKTTDDVDGIYSPEDNIIIY